jgi:hypothetical protein
MQMAVAAAPTSHSFSCDVCGAVLEVAAHERSTVCPYCDAPAVVERQPTAGRALPSFAVGFVLPRERAADEARRWIQSRWFTRSAFKRAPIEKVRAVYLPAYLYGAIARTRYGVEIGENYKVTYTTTNSKGQTVTRTRTKTEWRQLSGQHDSYVRDVVVTASRGISNDELERVEPFDLRALRRYDAAMIAGWPSEEASIDPETCRQMAQGEARDKIAHRLGAFMPGDKHRNLRHDVAIEQECLDLVLLPLWVFAVKYDAKKPAARVIVNGQTAKVAGEAPRSWVKILAVCFAIVAAAVAVALVVMR